MTSEVEPKVRLVRCPKCRLILPEMPDVPLYLCGECGTTLQAKSRKLKMDQAGPSLTHNSSSRSSFERDTGMCCGDSSVDHLGDNRSIISTSTEVNSCMESKDVAINANHIPRCRSMDHLGEDKSVISISPEVNGNETEDKIATTNMDFGDNKIVSPNLLEVNCSENGLIMPSSLNNLPDDKSALSTSTEVNNNCEGIARELDKPRDVDHGDNQSVLSTASEVNYTESEDVATEVDIPSRKNCAVLSTSLEVKCTETEVLDTEFKLHVDLNSANWTEVRDSYDELPSSVVVKGLTNGHMEPDGESNLNINKNESEESARALDERENFGDHVAYSPELEEHEADSPSGGGEVTKDKDSTSNEVITNEIRSMSGLAETSVVIEEDDVESEILREARTEKVSNEGVGDSILTLGNAHSGDYNLNHYHGSSSSMGTVGSSSQIGKHRDHVANSPTTRNCYAYDGSESSYDGTDDQIPEHSVPHPSKVKDWDSNCSTDIIKKDLINDNNEPEMNYWRPSSSSSILKEEKNWKHHAVKGKSHIRNGNSSVYNHHNLLPPRPDTHFHSAPNKMDLLRTVCELKEQLDRIQFAKPVQQNTRYSPVGIVPENHSAPLSYDQLGPGYHHRPNEAKSWVPHSRHNPVSCSCLHCYPQEWCHSAQLSSYYTHGSHSSSPPHYSSSEQLSLYSANQRHISDNEIKRSYLKEKYHTTKRNLRPVAGGAPVVICCNCWKILQIPPEFLLAPRKHHRLRCSSCTKVSKFSFIENTHIVPHVSENLVEQVSYVEDNGVRSLDRETSSGSHQQEKEDKKIKSVLKEPQYKSFFGSIGGSSKVFRFKKTSEIEEVTELKNSPLHRLMGYSSPSQVFRK